MACQFSVGFPRVSNVFTPEDISNFMCKEFSIKSTTNNTNFNNVSLENLIRANGLTKADVEEKIVQAAFETFAPGQPVIPNERVLKVLEFRKVQKLGKAYGIPSDISWAMLKKELTSRRIDILSVYKKELNFNETNMTHSSADSNISSSKRCRHPERNMLTSDQSKIPETNHASARRSLIPVYRPKPRPYQPSPKDNGFARDRCSNANAFGNDSMGSARSSLPAEEGTNDPTPRTSGILGRSILDQGRLPDNVNTRKRKRVHPQSKARRVVRQASHDERLLRAGVRLRTFSKVSIRTETYSVFQLAHSPEDQGIAGLDMDDWTDEDELLVPGVDNAGGPGTLSPSGSIPGESPYQRTMRKLQEFLDEAVKQKSSHSRSKEEKCDFWMAQDPGYEEDDAFLSPRRPNQDCAFVFRGCKFQAPPTAERVRRHRTPIWHIREDPGSPTPKPGFLANKSIVLNAREVPVRVAKPLPETKTANVNGNNSRPSSPMRVVGYCTPRPRKRVTSRRR